MEEVKEVAVIKVSGDIVSNDDKWIYDWFNMDATCPKDVESILEKVEPEEEIEVFINSGGGSVFAGSEIYSKLRARQNVVVKVESMAGSAASIIAMAGRCLISPVAMIMIHNVSMYGASGDYHDMQKNAEILKQMNTALATAYTEKTGKSKEEILKMMDRETWLTANQCLEMGFVDEIIRNQDIRSYTNNFAGMWLTDEIREKAKKQKAEKEATEEILNDLDLYGI